MSPLLSSYNTTYITSDPLFTTGGVNSSSYLKQTDR